jgi:catechol 2,3-dioxygenase
VEKSIDRIRSAIPDALSVGDHQCMETNQLDHSATSSPHLATEARLGVTRVAVTDLTRSIPFYVAGLGMQHLGTTAGIARMGVDEVVVLELAEEPLARRAGAHAGLFHVALLYPSRLELARVGKRLMERGIAIEGASDHLSHEAFYLPDPDGNGLELAADRPRAEWPDPQVEYATGPQPLDVQGLMALVADEPLVPQAAAGLSVGHMHLHVGDVDEALAFYRDVIGFSLTARLPTAAFVAVGGYHHHLGLNVWRGQGAPAAPADALGLRSWTVLVPDPADITSLVQRLAAAGIAYELHGDTRVVVRDPWNAELHVEVDPAR